jgi:starch synthase
MSNFSLYFESDGYAVNPAKIMGRHSAGSGFLKSAVKAADTAGESVSACVPNSDAGRSFEYLVRNFSPHTKAETFHVERLCEQDHLGGLYVPGPGMARFASLRLRGRPDAFSIVGVTHTIASQGALAAIAELTDSALMPWDALICTSAAVRHAVGQVLEAKIDFLRWRLGLVTKPEMPCLPVIPLGVHPEDFDFDERQRSEARSRLGLADDEIVLLFVGRLSFHAKAHPFPMFAGAENVARRNGKKIVLLMCGWFANEGIRQAFVDGANNYFPSGRTIFVDGSNDEIRSFSWAAADIFISLSDNIQESFGLTPVEAMSAGLPVLVTDWDGYRDTVSEGAHGYRIPVVEGLASAGELLAKKYEAGTLNYDMYCGLSCVLVAADIPVFTEQLSRLVENSSLRKSLGRAGKEHVLRHLDWKIIYQRYKELFDELAEIRAFSGSKWLTSLPQSVRASPDRRSPDQLFGHFATRTISMHDVLEAAPQSQTTLLSQYRKLSADPLFSFAQSLLPSEKLVGQLLSTSGSTLAAFAVEANTAPDRVISACVILMKMGLLSVKPGNTQGR